MNIEDLTNEDIDDIRQEARHRTKVNYDEKLEKLMGQYFDATNGRERVDAVINTSRALADMRRQGYSDPCRLFYESLWNYVREGEGEEKKVNYNGRNTSHN